MGLGWRGCVFGLGKTFSTHGFGFSGRPAIWISLGDRFGDLVVAGCRAPSGGRFYIVFLASGAPVTAAEGGDCPRCELVIAPESLRPSAGISLWRQSSGESLVSQSSGVQGYVGAGCRRVSRPERGVGAARAGRPARRSSRGPTRDPRGRHSPALSRARAGPGRQGHPPNFFSESLWGVGGRPAPSSRGAAPGRGPFSVTLFFRVRVRGRRVVVERLRSLVWRVSLACEGTARRVSL